MKYIFLLGRGSTAGPGSAGESPDCFYTMSDKNIATLINQLWYVILQMHGNDMNTNDTISGKAPHEVRNNLLGSIIKLKSRLRDRYDELLEKSSLDHVRMLLESLRDNESDDIIDLEEAIENGKITMNPDNGDDGSSRDHALVDHLVNEEEEIDHNDMSSVIKGALKLSIDMISLLSLMEQEYSSKNIKKTLEILIDRERKNKGKLEELYDTHVSKDYW